MRIALILIIIIHGLIHLLGFVKAFNLAQVDALTKNISKPFGVIWLLTAVLFIVTAILFFLERDWWWTIGAVSVIISQLLIILYWTDAKFGTIANLIIIIPVILALADNLPGSYKNRFKATVEEGLQRTEKQAILTQDDIDHLPEPVQKYLIYCNALGKEKVQNFRVVFDGLFKPNTDSDFTEFQAVQYNFYDQPTRAFYMKLKMFGLPLEGLHIYSGPSATMQIKIASLFEVVNARGPEMNKGETVTMFNDMCFLAPPTLIDKNIAWKTIDSLTVEAQFTNQNNTITAILYFNEKGELVDFASDDRYASADGKTYQQYKWTTPISDYKEFNDRRIASYGEAIWHKPDGPYCYGKFNVKDIQYNCIIFDAKMSTGD